MRAESINLDAAVGKLLSAPIFHATGKKLFAKGHEVSVEDARLLRSEGLEQVLVAVLDEGEIPEEDAAVQIAAECGCGSMEIRIAAGGRANIFATENCCLLVDDYLLRKVNESSCLTAATLPNFSFVAAGQRLASIKSAPFAVGRSDFDQCVDLIRREGPLMQARPVRNATVAVLYSDPLRADRARTLFEGIMRTRLERFGVHASFVLACVEDQASIARHLEHLLRARPTLVLMASTTAPAGPEDEVGRGMTAAGCQMESFLAPVEPGNLLLLGYAGETPVVAAPGCFRSPKANVIDLILPPLLSRYRLSSVEIATLGHGGLLQ